jgi:hypothetical protein
MIEAAMTYFDTRSVWGLLLLCVDGVLASMIFLILLFAFSTSVTRRSSLNGYERGIRFGLTAVYGILAMRIWAGWFCVPIEPMHVVINALVLGFMVCARGDVGVLTEALRQARKARQKVFNALELP